MQILICIGNGKYDLISIRAIAFKSSIICALKNWFHVSNMS